MAGVRHAVDPEADALEADPALVARIRDEIEQTGPITFARFMELALYEPGLGYYMTRRSTAGRTGDFLTAPEAHPIFGAAIGRQLAELWDIMGRPSDLTVREYGAGRGALIEGIVAGLRADHSSLPDLLLYQPVELNEHRGAELRARLTSVQAGIRIEPANGTFEGVVLANEFLDALPVHLVEQRGGRLLEVLVGWHEEGGSFIEEVADPSTPDLARRLDAEGIRLDEGQRGEICLALDGWLDEVAGSLRRGYVLVVDYGFEAQDLYGPRHRAGTLLGYRGHRVVDDPYAAAGMRDLTAHVDLTALVRGAEARGLSHLGTTTQAEFLVGAGASEILRRVQEDPATTFDEYVALRSSLARMLDPRASGGFRVAVFGRDVPPSVPSGLTFSIERRAR